MRAKIGHTSDGAVTFVNQTETGGYQSMSMTPEQAETMAHALLIQAYCARGNTPGESAFRKVRTWRLR